MAIEGRLFSAILRDVTTHGEGKAYFDAFYDRHMQTHFEVMAAFAEEFIINGYVHGTIYNLGCGSGTFELASAPIIPLLESKTKFVCVDSSLSALHSASKKLHQHLHFLRYLKNQRIISAAQYKCGVSSLEFEFYNADFTDNAVMKNILEKEGKPDTIIVSYCFHWLNAVGLVEKVIEEIYKHLADGGYFISIEEWPLRIGFEQNAVNDYIRRKTKSIDLEEQLYSLIRKKGFVDAAETIYYDINALQRLEPGFDTKKHTHVMYGKVFRKD